MNRIKELRLNAGLKQIDFCKILGVSQSTLSGYENNVSEPDINTILKIASYFDVTVDYLLGNSDKKNASTPNEADTYTMDSELEQLFEKLSEDGKQTIIDLARSIVSREQKK